MRTLLALFSCALLALGAQACSRAPVPAHPALWSVTDTNGRQGWLFGTIHSAPEPFAWRAGPVAQAFDRSRSILVEVGNLRDDTAVAATFSRLAKGHDEPDLSQRLAPGDRPALERLLKATGYRDDQFRDVETWAAALTLARNTDDSGDAANGVDRSVLASAGKRQVLELEGAEKQLGIFDGLPEREQRDLLAAIVHEASDPKGTDLTKSWRNGDVKALAAETHRGLLADPELREALYTRRNEAWAGKIAQAIRDDRSPFVAVGAAHMVGPEGLVTLLRRRGFTVERQQ